MSKSIAEAILEATRVLGQASVAEARREAGALLASVLNSDRTFLITHGMDLLIRTQLERFQQHVARRAAGEPLQYITGSQEFFGLEFEVNRQVLIPRPETELLVESALQEIGDAEAAPLICDIGTGSGCIAIALLHERPRARAVAVDVSLAAVLLASRNAARHTVSGRVSFVVADCFSTFRKGNPSFDLIVSNPPYIADGDLAGLQREVRDYEPRVALTSGSDGLSMIRNLLEAAPAFLVDGGQLIFEIGYGQRTDIEELIDARVWQVTSIRDDLQGIPRIVTLRKLGP